MTFRDDLKAIPSGKKDLRNFGLVMAAAFGLLGSALFFYEKPTYPIFAGFALIFLTLGLIAPNVLKPIQRAWMTLALILSWIMTRVLLVVAFFILITPLSLAMRVFGHKFLELSWKENRESYWIPRPKGDRDPRHCERQF